MLKAAVGALGAPARPPRGEAVDRGAARDRAEVARRVGLTRARLTQLMDLALLAPDIQEKILFLESVDGVEPMSKRDLWQIVRRERWGQQRERWVAGPGHP